MLEASKTYRAEATADRYDALQYISKLRKRIATIEAAYQRQSARGAALDEFRRIALEEMDGQVEGNLSLLLPCTFGPEAQQQLHQLLGLAIGRKPFGI